MYKDNIYIAFNTSKIEWTIVEYNPTNDVWNNFNQNHEINYILNDEGRLTIANDCLFFVKVCYPRTLNFTFTHKSISIFELNIEDKLLIPVTKIFHLEEDKSSIKSKKL